MNELEEFYNLEYRKYFGMPPFSALDEGSKRSVEKSLGFAIWKQQREWKKLKEEIKKNIYENRYEIFTFCIIFAALLITLLITKI